MHTLEVSEYDSPFPDNPPQGDETLETEDDDESETTIINVSSDSDTSGTTEEDPNDMTFVPPAPEAQTTAADDNNRSLIQTRSRTASNATDNAPTSNNTASTSNNVAPLRLNTNYAFIVEPSNVNEALKSPESKLWETAMIEELNSHKTNNTWQLADLPKGRKAIQNKWVFKIKRDAAGNISKYKARLVAKGFSQRPGIDFNETFSPVIRYDSIRYLLALAVTKKYRIEQMDAITAYLQSDLCEEIFMEQPDAYTDGTQRVCKLNKAIYGLKQASRQWNQKLDEALKKRGFRKSIADPCIYFSNDLSIIIAIYVDDFLIFYRHINDLNQTKNFLHSVFKMKDLGEARSCLGMKIHQHNDGIDIDQSTYIEDILKRFGMQDCKPMGTPSDTSQKLSANMVNEENDLTGKIAYREAVGSLIHLANCTRPDIAFAVNNVSRFNAKHGTEHWGAVKRIFRYLKGTINLKLRFRNDNIGQLYAFCDSDWASDPDKRRSCSGFTVQMANAAISWHSHLQEIVALSSTEAEYIALSECVKQVLWLRKLTK